MADNKPCCSNLEGKLRTWGIDKKFSDVKLMVIEGNTAQPSKVIPTHKFLLAWRSPYFEKVFGASDDITELEIKVKENEAKYFEILISTFYDENALKDLDIGDLLGVCILAAIYGDAKCIGTLIHFLDEVEINIDNALLGLQTIFSIEKAEGIISDDLKKKLRRKCAVILAEYYFPLEEETERYADFRALDYSVLYSLLESGEVLVRSENSLLVFLNEWLEHDVQRQTDEIIGSLLTKITMKDLNGTFLYKGITKDHKVFSKWSGFLPWIFDCLGYVSTNNAAISVSSGNAREKGICKWFTDKKRQNLSAVRWAVQMTPVDAGKKFGPTEYLFVHDGMKLLPKSVDINPIEGETENYSLSLTITSSFPMDGMKFVIGVTLAEGEHDPALIYFHSPFARSFLKLTEASPVGSCCQTYDYWLVSKEFVDKANECGLYVLLLPVTNCEFSELGSKEVLSTCEQRVHIHDNIHVHHKVFSRCVNGHESLSTSTKITLMII